MKKMLAFLVVSALAVTSQAATVGWNIGKTDASYKGDAYQLFIVGQKGVPASDAIKFITDKLDAGTDVSSYAYGGGTLTSNVGGVSVSANAANGTLDPGTYTSFFVVYDTATPTAGTSNYAVLSGASNQTRTFTSSASTVSFQSGDMSSVVGNSSNWHAYGVPEPTTVALLALGLAAVGLKRKVA